METSGETVIIGAGLAGLACARRLRELGRTALVLEASDRPGGRIRTDVVDGFRLDHGFQVFLPAYPEAQSVLDYDALDLRPWRNGAAVWAGGRFHRVSDPSDGVVRALATLFSSTMHASDALPFARLREELRRVEPEALWRLPERPARDELAARGFSDRFIHRLFRPFFGAVFFDAELTTSNRMLLFVYAMFTREGAATPAGGMGAIPAQLAARLDGQRLRYRTRVAGLAPDRRAVRLASGEEIPAAAVVVATDQDEGARLLAGAGPAVRGWRGTQTFWFDAPEAPVADAVIVLDGDGTGPINHLAVPSNAVADHAPRGRHLVAASTVGLDGDEAAVRAQLGQWFGRDAVAAWRLLRTDRIPQALPDQGSLDPPRRTTRLAPGLYVCGDHRDNASIDGALQSGRRAAEAVYGDLTKG